MVFSSIPRKVEKMNCETPQLFARRLSSMTHSSGVPMSDIGDARMPSGV